MPSTNPTADINMEEPPTSGKSKRLVLCFDGTSNKYQSNRSDTNIVKIYQMLARNDPDQYHYYQPGIGTYSAATNANSGSIRIFPKTRAYLTATIDQMFGISFVDHVLGGYKFVMRYYAPGDDIYIFGFSRGAYTARFLAEMLHNIGLLSRGNEEMVYFAWEAFSNYQRSRGNDPQSKKDADIDRYMQDFKRTFCRPGLHVKFLGMFDCVNSVGQFEIPLWRKSYRYIATPAARHVRHAVSLHERRLKFKPALCLFHEHHDDGDGSWKVDSKELWFAGNHGDIGGGWPPEGGEDGWLLSDTPLNWMVGEMLRVGGEAGKLAVLDDEVAKHTVEAERLWKLDDGGALKKPIKSHDPLKYGHGAKWYMTFIWWIIELIPIASRLELKHDAWIPTYFPPNLGSYRDVPRSADLHDSVDAMLNARILGQDMQYVRGGVGFWGNLRRLFGFSVRVEGTAGEEGARGGGGRVEGANGTPADA